MYELWSVKKIEGGSKLNREIRFRGKRVNCDEWVYGVPVKHFRKTYILEMTDFEEDRVYSDIPTKEMWSHEVIPVTVGQYTGLKDSNGVGIFEGDMLLQKDDEFGDIYSEVIYTDGSFMVLERGYAPELLLDEVRRDVVVTGNIYENPELLEGEN